MPLVGTLSTISLPDLLQWLASARKTGTLQVERNKVTKWIQVSEGRVVGCSTDDPPQRLGQYLLARERINERQLREALKLQVTTRQHLGRILVERGLLSREDLTEHLEAKAEDTLYSLFDWNDAVFRFEETLDEREGSMTLDLRVEDILLRGLKRYDEMSEIREVFDDPRIVLRYTSTPPPPEIYADSVARSTYSAIDGERSLAEILLHLHGSEYTVLKFYFDLYRGGFVEIAHRPAAEAEAGSATAPLPSPTPDPSGPPDLCVPPPGEPFDLTLLDEPAAESAPATPAPRPPATAAPVPAPARPVAAVAERPGAAVACAAPTAAPAGALEQRLTEARSLMTAGATEQALSILDELYRQHPADDALRRLIAEAEADFVDRTYRYALPAEKVPVLARPVESLSSAPLSPQEFFMLSRVDGSWDVRSIIQIAPLREVDALRALKRMRELGMIDLRDPA